MTAQKLAHVDEAGEGEAEVDKFDHQLSVLEVLQVDVTWNDLKGSCMIMLRPRSSIFA